MVINLHVLFVTRPGNCCNALCMQTVPPRRASLARATALYLERKATSEAGAPLATSESGTPVANSSTTTPLRSPYSRAYSTGANAAAVGIRTLPVTPSRGSLSLAPVPEGTADSPAGRLFHSRSEGGLGSCSTAIITAPAAAAEVEAADATEAVSKADSPQTAAEESEAQLGAPLVTDNASGAAASLMGKTATSSPFAASTAEQTPDKQQQQHQEQEPATEPWAGSSSIRSMSSRKGRDSQPGSSRLGLFYSPQTSRQPSLRRGSDTDSRKHVSVRALAANFDAAATAAAATMAAGAGAGAGGVRGYRVRSETGYAGRKAPAAGGRGAGGKWQQLGAAGASASPTTDRPGAGSKSKCIGLLWA